ncbi:tetratricopeptide repeat protein [Emticicia fluvialis]|uniref:tetratricopeptide repeat protein n=1 Tax=Emticicia fluvialis TaxID=2974474 RepID=UPI00216566FA|nr:tetratricopeptide repeat protein [Emticicia fluvialis]
MKNFIYLFVILFYGQTLAQTTADNTLSKAKALMNDYRFGEAIQMLAGCNTQPCLLEKGFCYAKTGDYKQSDTFYGKVLVADSSNRTALFQIANNAESTGNYKKAKTYYTKLLKVDSTNATYLKLLGVVYTKLGNDSLAMVLLRKAISLNDLDCANELGKVYMRRNMTKNCLNLVERHLKYDSAYLPLHQLKVKALYKEMKFQEVIPAIRTLMALGDSSLAYQRMLGFAYYRTDSTRQCIEVLEKYTQKGEPEEGIDYFLGLAYMKENNMAKAKIHFEKAIAMGVSENIADYYYTLGYINEKEKNYSEAIDAYNNAYLFDDRPYLLFLMARTYDWKNDKNHAVEFYNKYLLSSDTVKQYRSDATKRLEYLKAR